MEKYLTYYINLPDFSRISAEMTCLFLYIASKMKYYMNTERIIEEYLSLSSSQDIAKKFDLRQSDVKLVLRSGLGKEKFLEIAHKIGAKKVYDKLASNPGYKKRYSEKMKSSVRDSLSSKMKNKKFRSKWLLNARAASKKGTRKIRELLSEDKEFLMRWRSKCKIGGINSLVYKKGIHEPKMRFKRRAWSIKGLRRTGKKLLGPNEESMYNQLEVDVARILSKAGLKYCYEKIVSASNKNGFYSLDFVVSNKIVIEVTCWYNVKHKAKELRIKFEYLKDNEKFQKFILITRKGMCDTYKRLLPSYVLVLTSRELESLIAGTAG